MPHVLATDPAETDYPALRQLVRHAATVPAKGLAGQTITFADWYPTDPVRTRATQGGMAPQRWHQRQNLRLVTCAQWPHRPAQLRQLPRLVAPVTDECQLRGRTAKSGPEAAVQAIGRNRDRPGEPPAIRATPKPGRVQPRHPIDTGRPDPPSRSRSGLADHEALQVVRAVHVVPACRALPGGRT